MLIKIHFGLERIIYLYIRKDFESQATQSTLTRVRSLSLIQNQFDTMFVYTIYFIKTHKRLHGISGVWDH